MRAPGAAILAAFLIVLAGCAAPEAGPAGATDPGATKGTGSGADNGTVASAVEAPTWALGDWWKYRVEFIPSELSYDMTIVVYGEEGGSWLLSGTERAPNIQSEFSHFPTLGPWTQSDLQATIHGAQIPFFKWPLEDGKTWSDPYRGIPATWTAAAAEVQTPKGAYPGFDLGLVVEDGQYANYSYAPEVGWFAKLEQGFGAPSVRMTLLDWGHNHTGSVSVLRFVEHLHRPLPIIAVDPGAGPPTFEPQQRFTVGAGGSLAWGFYFGGAPGFYGFSFRGAAPDMAALGITSGGPKTDSAIGFEYGELPNAAAGEWIATGGGATHGFGFAFGEILEVHEVG